jgi:hypothetical protein
VKKNLDLLGTYRDNSVHFYNAKDFGILLYALAQTSIMNYRDLLSKLFNINLEDEITWHLLPLGIKPPLDVIAYISGKSTESSPGAVRQYISELARANDDLKTAGEDTGRLLTVFNVKLESIKKIGDADVLVGVRKDDGNSGPLTIFRTQDPNITHPLRQKDIVAKIGALHGKRFTDYTFQTISWKHGIKANPQYCWRAKEGVLTKYSNDVVTFIQRLTAADTEAALADYRLYLRSRFKKRTANE